MADDNAGKTQSPFDALRHFPDVIRAVTSGIGLVALGILVVFVIAVAVVVFRGEADAVTVLFGFSVVIIVFVVAGLIFSVRSPAPANSASPIKYDVYISAPMDGLNEENEYLASKNDIDRIKVDLRVECKMDRAFYAGTDLDFEKWDVPELGFKADWKALVASKYFLMIYPSYVPSSVIFEAGLAVGLRKPSIWFVRKGKKLPYLLEGGPMASNDGDLPLIRMITYETVEDIHTAFKVHKHELFSGTDGSAA